jgi:hypothetical protein
MSRLPPPSPGDDEVRSRLGQGPPADVIDVFDYVVVLNLAIEYVPSVISEGFTLKLVDLVFGDAVSLGGFIPVTLLVVAPLVSRSAVRRHLDDTPGARQ